MKIAKEKDKIQQQFADIQQASEEVGQRVWNVFMMFACLSEHTVNMHDTQNEGTVLKYSV